jgi:hypothetical protein
LHGWVLSAQGSCCYGTCMIRNLSLMQNLGRL